MVETATEISPAGYTKLAIGTKIYNDFPYIEFRDGSGGKITRFATGGNSTVADSRISHVTPIADKAVVFTVNFTGAEATDPDIAAYMLANSGSCTFKTAVMKDDNTDGDTNLMASDDFTTATIADANDSLTITVSVGIGVDTA